MITKYGEIPNKLVRSSLKRYIGKTYKILPMTEEECETVDVYVSSLLKEIIGNYKLLDDLKYEGEFLSLIGTLQSLEKNNMDLDECKQDVFKAIDIIKKMIKRIDRG